MIARGLDVDDVSHVVNFDLSPHIENYIHRIGRTGRQEKEGVAISFFDDEDLKIKAEIEALMDKPIPDLELPPEVELSEELISLEEKVEFVPFNNHKVKQFKPSGEAFHEKLAKNKKTNVKKSYEDKMKKKYKKQYRSKDSR